MQMKAAIAALTICVASPMFGQSYLETRLDVEAGAFTHHELVRIMQAVDKDAEIEAIHRNREELAEKMNLRQASGGVVSTSGAAY